MVKICFAFYDIEDALIKKSDNHRPAFSKEGAKNDILVLIKILPLFLTKVPLLEDLSFAGLTKIKISLNA